MNEWSTVYCLCLLDCDPRKLSYDEVEVKLKVMMTLTATTTDLRPTRNIRSFANCSNRRKRSAAVLAVFAVSATTDWNTFDYLRWVIICRQRDGEWGGSCWLKERELEAEEEKKGKGTEKQMWHAREF